MSLKIDHDIELYSAFYALIFNAEISKKIEQFSLVIKRSTWDRSEPGLDQISTWKQISRYDIDMASVYNDCSA